MENNRICDDFNQFSPDYRKIHNENVKLSGGDSNYFSEHKIQIVKKEEGRDNIKFLDFGYGDGNSARFFLKYFPKRNYFGIDILSEIIKIAKSKKILNADFQKFDIEKLPFSYDSFDMVFTACVFHHIKFQYHKNLIQEIYRV
jgi:ubiquinone/menaquinone biosynthesis C-methylase UbiE